MYRMKCIVYNVGEYEIMWNQCESHKRDQECSTTKLASFLKVIVFKMKKNIFSNLYKCNVNVNLDERNSEFQFCDLIKENGYYS